jgi:hypothetical protein
VARLYHQALGFHFVASYDSQGYGGGIRTRLHTQFSYQLHTSVALPPGKGVSGTHWIGGWMDRRAGLNAAEERKSLWEWNSDSSVVQPIA